MKSILRDIFDEKVAKIEPTWEPKWSQNGAKVAPRSVENEKCKKCENRTGARAGARFSGLGLVEKAMILEQNTRKKRVRIEVKIKIDFEVDFGAKMEPKWSPKGAKMEAKSEKNRFKIDVKFEVDFGCDLGWILASRPGGVGGMCGAGLTQIRAVSEKTSSKIPPQTPPQP